MISLRFVNHRNHEVSLHHYVTLKKCFWRPVICILIKDHRMNCKRLYFDYVWNKYILINKTEWLLTVLKKMVRLWDDIQRFGVLTKTASVQVFSAILPWCLHSIYVCGQSLSRVWLLVNPWTAALQAPLSMGILQARIREWVSMPSSRGYIILPTFSSLIFINILLQLKIYKYALFAKLFPKIFFLIIYF